MLACDSYVRLTSEFPDRLRVRPMRAGELDARPEGVSADEALCMLRFPEDNKLTVDGNTFEFDAVFPPSTTQEQVYR
jgi:hypothetical protein